MKHETGSEFKVVPVKDEDTLKKCLTIRRKVFVEEQSVSLDIEVDEYDVPDGICDHFLLLAGSLPIGTFRCRKLSPDTLKLQRFCVLNEWRGKGHGSRMLDFLDDYCKAHSVMRIVLDSQCTAVGFYRDSGYEEVSDVFEEAGILHVKMEKILVF